MSLCLSIIRYEAIRWKIVADVSSQGWSNIIVKAMSNGLPSRMTNNWLKRLYQLIINNNLLCIIWESQVDVSLQKRYCGIYFQPANFEHNNDKGIIPISNTLIYRKVRHYKSIWMFYCYSAFACNKQIIEAEECNNISTHRFSMTFASSEKKIHINTVRMLVCDFYAYVYGSSRVKPFWQFCNTGPEHHSKTWDRCNGTYHKTQRCIPTHKCWNLPCIRRMSRVAASMLAAGIWLLLIWSL